VQVASFGGRYGESPTIDIQSYVYSNAINKWMLKVDKFYESKTETNRIQENQPNTRKQNKTSACALGQSAHASEEH